MEILNQLEKMMIRNLIFILLPLNYKEKLPDQFNILNCYNNVITIYTFLGSLIIINRFIRI